MRQSFLDFTFFIYQSIVHEIDKLSVNVIMSIVREFQINVLFEMQKSKLMVAYQSPLKVISAGKISKSVDVLREKG